MSRSFRALPLPLLAALISGLFHGALALAFLPAERQFTKYPRAAAQYLSGTLPPERLLDFSPFYFYLHVAQEALIPGAGPAPILALQILAVAAAAGLLFVLLERFFPPWLAVAGTAAFILSRSAVVYASVLEPEAFLLLFLLAFLCFSLPPTHRGGASAAAGGADGDGWAPSWSHAGGAAPRARLRAWLLAALALALSLSIRPSVLPLFAVVPLFFLVNEGRRRWLLPTAVTLAPALVVLLALGLRNGVATGEYSPLGMNPGFVFFEGNNPLSTGRSAVYPPLVGELKQEIADHPDNPHLTYRLIAARESGRELSTAEANRYWRGKALAFIADHPGRFLSVLAVKAHAILHAYRGHDLIVAEHFDRRLREGWVPVVPFALISVLALGGLVTARRDWRALLLLYALFASQLLLMLLLYVSDRQRLAILPGFVFFACAAAAWLAGAGGARRRVVGGGAVAILAIVLTLPNDRMRDDRHLWDAFEISDLAWPRAVHLRDEGQFIEAAQVSAIAYAATPWMRDYTRPGGIAFGPREFAVRALEMLAPDTGHPSRRFDRAQLLIAAGRLEEAEALLEGLEAQGARFDRLFMQPSHPAYFRARIRTVRGERAEAARLLGRALADSPGDPFVLAQLAALTGEDVHRQRIERYFSGIDAAFLVALAQFENDLYEEASENLSVTVRRLPELWRARMYLAAALAGQGETAAAIRTYEEATAARKDPAMLEEQIVGAFAAAARTAPDDAMVRYSHGQVLVQYGRFEEALGELRAAYALEPTVETERAIAGVERYITLTRR